MDSTKLEDVRRDLNRLGRRMTPQRAAILSALCASRSHPTAEELRDHVRERMPRISLGTVYRNLGVLVAEGYALRLPSLGGHHRFDGDTTDHHHVICRVCGKIADVRLGGNTDLFREVAAQSGYRVLAHRMEFEGACAGCERARSEGV